MLLWYNTDCTYPTEAEFWEWKKLVMAKVLRRLQENLIANSGSNAFEAILAEYQREIDYALIEAASADAHTTEVMKYLLQVGANINLEANSQIVGQTWSNALSEEVPTLFKSKVDFLIDQGVHVHRVWSWERTCTPIEFLLTKLHRCFPFSNETTFVLRVLECADFLESRGCFRWPSVVCDEADDGEQNDWDTLAPGAAEPGMRELADIFADTDRRLLPLQTMLRERLLKFPRLERTWNASERTEPCLAITRLNALHGAWIASRP
ncbi:hypothetical protein CKAH01_14326 [Colletotrichum kahawae]|uniref:Ankyrin repeat protein n=1 Tax=Colletotrichum kahawae TaxID=34407 RepID=A0AAD9YM38_COLKA|nr:hypothetical protein CKAH01_14326 [Colletotrichum kahawae]